MKIHFITSAHNSLSQRLWLELTYRHHIVSVGVAKDATTMRTDVAREKPDLVVCPMLKTAIPEDIWRDIKCLIVHPGIRGDRGPASLDWALMNEETIWGVTILEAAAEFDAGAIWASHEFLLDDATLTKSSLYRNAVTEAAVQGVLEAVDKFCGGKFQPEPLDYDRPGIRGKLRPPMRQTDRCIDWMHDSTAVIARKIRAADSAPGVMDSILGRSYFLYGAYEEENLVGPPGRLLARRDGAVCLGTIDGAIWITHLKATAPTADNDVIAGIKLPAVQVLGNVAKALPYDPIAIDEEVNYRTYREIRYEERDHVGYLDFDFCNGAMSTEQCYRLRDAFLYARSRPTRVIVLRGGKDFWSNGIHLNIIEASVDPAMESWQNINAIDDLIIEILNTVSHIVIAGLRGNAGAGGAMLALAADHLYARSGVVLNPHYKSMGNLYGSEYWTYTLPRRVGPQKALELTEGCLPLSAEEAKAIGFLDDVFGSNRARFELELTERARIIAESSNFWCCLRDKHEARIADERTKRLASYRAEELSQMRINFFGPDPAYHDARRRFVYKGNPRTRASEFRQAQQV